MEDNLQGIASRFPPDLTESLSGLIESLTASLGDVVGTIGSPTVAAAGSIARNIPNVLINVIFAVLSAYFFIAERERILQWGREHTPESLREKWHFILEKFRKAVGGYFKAQFKIMGVVALITPWIVPVVMRLCRLKMTEEIWIIDLLFTFFASLIGSCFGGYGVPFFDKVLHFISGILLTNVGVLLFQWVMHASKWEDAKT